MFEGAGYSSPHIVFLYSLGETSSPYIRYLLRMHARQNRGMGIIEAT